MKVILALPFLILCGCEAKHPEIIKPIFESHEPNPHPVMVGVYSKSHPNRFVAIYADKAMTTPLANPLLSDAKGNVVFYADPKDCCDVEPMINKTR